MKRKFTILSAALVLLAFLTLPLGMMGQTREAVTLQYSGSTTTNMTGNNDATLVGLDSQHWSVVGDKGSNNNFPGLNKDGSIRLYYHANGSNTITVSNLDNYTITTIAVTYKQNYNNGTITVNGNLVTGSGSGLEKTYEINASSFVISNGNTSNVQVHITKVVMNYIMGPAPTVATPTFNPESGTEFGDEGLQVTISCETDGVDIYYTLDGTEPDDESIGYNAPITLTETTTIKAIAYDGDDNTSTVATATYIYVDPNAPGTENNPYTVAQARAAIDANTGTQGVYATGIVSAIPTAYNAQYSNITFNMVDEEGDEDFLQAYRCGGDLAFEVALGDVVVVYGNLKNYNGTYEFDANCQLVSLTHPSVLAPAFSIDAGGYAEAQSVELSCETPNAVIYYTLDGSDPTNASTQYDGAISVPETTTIKAIAYVGTSNSPVAEAAYYILSNNNVYTVTEALAFSSYPQNNIFVSGIVSTAPESLISNAQLTYYISVDGQATNELEVYKGRGLNNADFTSDDDIQVGDIVTIFGNVQEYQGTIEFASGNYLVSFERPVVPIINAENITLSYDATSGEIEYTITNPVTGTVLNATTDAEWISNIVVGETSITFNVTENEGDEDRIATIILTYTGAQNKEVTVTQEHFVVDYATLPFEFDGGRADIANTNGLTQEGLDTDYGSSPKLKFNSTNDWVILHFDERPGTLTFDIKGNPPSQGSWAGTFTVQTSEDGENYTDLEAYTSLTTTVQSAIFDNLDENVRYIRWIYTNKVGGNVALGNIHLYEFGVGPVLETYDLTIEPFENLEIFTFVGGDENDPLEGAGTFQVTEGDQVMLSITANEGYVLQSLIVDGVEHVNDIDDAATYTFSMPSHNVTVSATAVEDVPPTPFEATYTLATTIESGKTYIITSEVFVDEIYAMGGQNNNNRAAIATDIEGSTVTVETDEVYEVVITLLDETTKKGDALYSIFDARNNGYLYAASSSSNYLRTKSELDDNGKWTIAFGDNGVAIKAQGNNTRNLIRYNGGSNIFSCYASGQGDIYLYVKEETVGVTQVLELSEGWNWVSFNVEGDPVEMLQALEAGLEDNALEIQSFNTITEYDGEWWGELDDIGITSDQMYMILVSNACTVELEGMPVNVSGCEIAINPGWNWIGYPGAEAMDIIVAFAEFEAEIEDVIQAAEIQTEYDGEWWGELETLEPGQGYMYFSNSEEVKTLVFPTVGSKARAKARFFSGKAPKMSIERKVEPRE